MHTDEHDVSPSGWPLGLWQYRSIADTHCSALAITCERVTGDEYAACERAVCCTGTPRSWDISTGPAEEQATRAASAANETIGAWWGRMRQRSAWIMPGLEHEKPAGLQDVGVAPRENDSRTLARAATRRGSRGFACGRCFPLLAHHSEARCCRVRPPDVRRCGP